VYCGYCLFATAYSTIDAISFIRRIVLWSPKSSPQIRIWLRLRSDFELLNIAGFQIVKSGTTLVSYDTTPAYITVHVQRTVLVYLCNSSHSLCLQITRRQLCGISIPARSLAHGQKISSSSYITISRVSWWLPFCELLAAAMQWQTVFQVTHLVSETLLTLLAVCQLLCRR